MTPAERWQLVSDLFNDALELPREERQCFLERSGHDDEVVREVMDLIADEEDAGDGLLARPYFSWRGSSSEGDVNIGRQVGPYRLVRQLGHGGMGAVYLAERDDGEFEQQVAIKLIHPSLASGEMLSRFRSERQILARLSHPHVAGLLDGGTTKDGLPFIVMEYVDGRPIDEHCNAGALSIRQRLVLFRQVCSALSFAHQNLVVHRDLKPGNILVTSDSQGAPGRAAPGRAAPGRAAPGRAAPGRVKLLDFGIAKLLQGSPSRGSLQPLVTRQGTAPMTPPYASPEQIRGEAVNTASDVYSLGVVLYELLTGRRPHEAESPEELALAIREQAPRRPSTVSPGARLRFGERRPGEEPKRLRRLLAGDLDNIVLKAIRKEPDRRFSSVEQFSEDLRRYLEGLPVRSRRDTLTYRVDKFIRRNALGVVLGSALALALVTFSILMAVQRVRIGQQNEEIIRQNEEIVHQSGLIAEESDRAREAMDFLISILRVPDPTRGTGAEFTVREALDAAAKGLRLATPDRSLTRATLLDTVGRVYINLELLGEAEPLLEEALALRRSEEAKPSIAESLHHLALLKDRQGQPAEAEALRREAIDLQRAAFPEGHPDLARGLNNLAQSLRRQRKINEAESLAGQALAMQERLLGGEHLDVARTLNTLATLARYRGEYDKAEALYRRSIAIRQTHVGEDDAGLAKTLNNFAQLLVDGGAIDEAVQLHEKALKMRQRLFAGDHRDRTISLNSLGLTLVLNGSLDRGLEMLDQALAEGKRLGLSPTFLAVFRKNRGLALFALGKAEAALEEVEWALQVFREGNNTARIAEAESLQAACRASLGDFAGAEADLLRGYETLAESLGQGAWQTRLARVRLAEAYNAIGRTEEAVRYREAPPK